MKTMYRVKWGNIEALPVLRETNDFVVLEKKSRKSGEEREAKATSWYTWHATWEDAHAHMVAEAQTNVDLLRQKLERANGDLGRIKGMKKPASLTAEGGE